MCELLVRLSLFLILLLTNWKSFKICLWFCYFHPLSPDHPWGLHCVFSQTSFVLLPRFQKSCDAVLKVNLKNRMPSFENELYWQQFPCSDIPYTIRLANLILSLLVSDWSFWGCLFLEQWTCLPVECCRQVFRGRSTTVPAFCCPCPNLL